MQPGHAPRTLEEADELSWMAERNYGNARVTMLAARDKDGFLDVIEQDDQSDVDRHLLLYVTNDGRALDASIGFVDMTAIQIDEILQRYPDINKEWYLSEAAKEREENAERQKRSVSFVSRNKIHTVTCIVYTRDEIIVILDNDEEQEHPYSLRAPTEEEKQNPQLNGIVAVLVPREDVFERSVRPIYLSQERNDLIEQKIEEIVNGV